MDTTGEADAALTEAPMDAPMTDATDDANPAHGSDAPMHIPSHGSDAPMHIPSTPENATPSAPPPPPAAADATGVNYFVLWNSEHYGDLRYFKCQVPGCDRPSWNNQAGESCCRACAGPELPNLNNPILNPVGNGQRHGPICQECYDEGRLQGPADWAKGKKKRRRKKRKKRADSTE